MKISSKRKAICFILSLAICIGLVPSGVFAVEENIQTEKIEALDYRSGSDFDYLSIADVKASLKESSPWPYKTVETFSGVPGVIAGDEFLPTVIQVFINDRKDTYNLYWLYESKVGVGTTLSNADFYTSSAHSQSDISEWATVNTIAGQYFYWPAPPSSSIGDDSIRYLDLTEQEVSQIADKDLKALISSLGNKIPVYYDFTNLKHLSINSLYNATKISQNRQTVDGPYYLKWQGFTISNDEEGSKHNFKNLGAYNKYTYNFKHRAAPSILTMWQSSASDVKAADNHFGNFIEYEGNYFAPRYVLNTRGKAVSYVSFAVDVDLKGSSIMQGANADKGLSTLYPSPDKYPYKRNDIITSSIERGAVNSEWFDTSSKNLLRNESNAAAWKQASNGKWMLNRDDEGARALLDTVAYMEWFFGESVRSEIFYDGTNTGIASKAYQDPEGSWSDRGWTALMTQGKKELAGLLKDYDTTPCTIERLSNMSEAEQREAKDLSLTWKALVLLTYCEVSGYAGDINGKGLIENGAYIKVSQTRNKYNNYNSWTLGKVVNCEVANALSNDGITKDLVVADAQENKLINDSYYGTNLWRLKDDVSDSEIEKILGMTKEQFKKLATSNKEINAGKIEELGRDDFLSIFEVVNKEDGLIPDNVYILQSSVYMNLLSAGLDEAGDIFNLRPYSYHSDISLGFNSVLGKSDMPAEFKKPLDVKEGAYQSFYLLSDLSNKNDGHRIMPVQDSLIQNSQANNLNSYLVGNPLSPFSYKNNPNEDYIYFTPWSGFDESNTIDGVIDGYSNNDAYRNSLTAPNSDDENKAINNKVYRAVFHMYSEDGLAKQGITADNENAYLAINVFLKDVKAQVSENPNYSKESYSRPDLSTKWVEMVSDAYYFKKDNILSAIKADEEIKNNAGEIEKAIKKYESSGKSKEDREQFIRLINYSAPDSVFVQVFGTSYRWMFGTDGKVNVNDNINSKNDGITLYYKIAPGVKQDQFNLGITYITIYGKQKTGGDWKEIYRSTSGEVAEIYKSKKGIIDLTAQGITLNTNMDYVICIGQGFKSFNPKSINSLGPDNSLYMYGFIQGLSNQTDSKIYPDYSFTTGPIAQSHAAAPWRDDKAGLNTEWGEMRSASGKPSEATLKGWNPSQAGSSTDHQNQILSGAYYASLIAQGKGMTDSAGNQYIEGAYSLGVHDDWSREKDDTKNNNTALPLPVDMIDPEDLVIKYRFTNSVDFDNAITEVFLIDKDGNRIDLTQDCYDPAWLTDIDVGKSSDGKLTDSRYSLVVKVQRLETGAEHKDIATQSELSFYGSMFGNDYLQNNPLILSAATSTNQITKYKDSVSNNNNTLIKNGDYITYYINNLSPTSSTDICGTFTFKHRDSENKLSVADMNMLNNYRKGAVSWGPLDFVVSNLQINPEKLYVPADQSFTPQNGQELNINFSCDVEATYTDKNGNTPIINNDIFLTNFSIMLEKKDMSRPESAFPLNRYEGTEVYRINNLRLTINGGAKHISGTARINQRIDGVSGVEISKGSQVIYYKNDSYRFTARINGGNAIAENSTVHENQNDQRVKLETIHTNNKDYAYLEMSSPPPDNEPLCQEPRIRNDWQITFHWTKCPSELWDSHTVCSGDPSSCTTYTDCHPQGCFSWSGTYPFHETYRLEAYAASQANGWKDEKIAGNIEIRAGQQFQVRIKTFYDTDRWNMPDEQPWGGCSYCSRSPGYSRPSAYRHVRVTITNPEGGQTWVYSTYNSGWIQEHNSPILTIPENTKNLTLQIKVETSPFWGYREKDNQPLCDNLSTTVRITNPLPIAEGTTFIN